MLEKALDDNEPANGASLRSQVAAAHQAQSRKSPTRPILVAQTRGLLLLNTRTHTNVRHAARARSAPRLRAFRACARRAFLTPCRRARFTSSLTALRADASLERRKSQLEKYFEEHQIEGRLNGMLNDMVLSRPSQPYSWLARRMRRDEMHAPSTRTTMPQLSAAAAASFIGADIEKAWSYCSSFTGGAAAAVPARGAAKGKAAPAKGGLTLDISKLGSGVLLTIREQ